MFKSLSNLLFKYNIYCKDKVNYLQYLLLLLSIYDLQALLSKKKITKQFKPTILTSNERGQHSIVRTQEQSNSNKGFRPKKFDKKKVSKDLF